MAKKPTQPDELMVVNDVPGEECRIAILQDGHLEELYTERASSASSVGNIYKARVTNVESAIQAAFVDIGLEKAAFLYAGDYIDTSRQLEGEEVQSPRRRRGSPRSSRCRSPPRRRAARPWRLATGRETMLS